MTMSFREIFNQPATNFLRPIRSVFVFFVIGLAGCNGGGSGNDGGGGPPPPTPPPTSGITIFAGALGGAGNVDGTPGRLASPYAVAVDSKGAVFVADTVNCKIRKIVGGTVSTFYGNTCFIADADGRLKESGNFNIFVLTTDGADNVYFKGDLGIYKIAPDGTFSPSSITSNANSFDKIAFDAAATLFSVNIRDNAVYRLDADDVRTLVAGGTRSSFEDPNPYADGVGAAAKFNQPGGIAIANDGVIYVADTKNHAIRKVTRAGVVTTLAGAPTNRGAADGNGPAAQFNEPTALALDSSGNVYVADSLNYTIRKITPAGAVTTLAGAPGSRGAVDGAGAAARFNDVAGVSVDKSGAVFVGDTGNNAVRRISPDGNVTTIAGVLPPRGSADGAGTAARFSGPRQLAIDATGNILVADTDNATIRKISPAGGVTTLAGNPAVRGEADGLGAAASFLKPVGIALDTLGNSFVMEDERFLIRKISPAGQVTTFKSEPRVGRIPPTYTSVGVDNVNNVYTTSRFASLAFLGKITPAGVVSNLSCGTRCYPDAVTTDNLGNVYVATIGTIHRIAPDGTVVNLAGDAAAPLDVYGSTDGTGAAARFNNPLAIAADNKGNLFVADTGNHTVRKITSAGVVTTIAGKAGVSGTMTGNLPGLLNSPRGIVVDGAGNLYVSTENAVVKIVP
jgi:sugar lactone lactonase YvrE